MLDAEKVQKDLENDHAIWARKRHQSDLTPLIEDLKRLEFGLSMTLIDCLSLGRQCWKDRDLALIDSLYQSFAAMNTVFKDLKKIRMALSEVHTNPSDLQQLVIDWGRFKK